MDVKPQNAGDMFESCLDKTGAFVEIQHAIKTKDHAKIIRAATNGLEKTLSLKERIADTKSVEKSNEFRKQGNKYYFVKDYKKTIECFNKALAYAPIGSTEQVLAYSNISAVLLSIKAYQGCQLNIAEARTLNCPANIKTKLDKRKEETYKHINEEMIKDVLLQCDSFMTKFLEFDVPKNAQISCASKDVAVDDDKNVVAANDIGSCTMIALEKAYVRIQDSYNEYTSCYYCHRINFRFVPCEGCCKALFCSKECREQCMKEFHRIECQIVAYPLCYNKVPLTTYENSATKMAIRAAIKMSLQMSWEELCAASLQIGKGRLHNSSVKESFDPNSPTSLLSYDDQVTVDREKLIKSSLVCAYALHNLGLVPGYLPEDKNERDKAIDALSRIMLNLSTKFLREIVIESAGYDLCTETYRCVVQRNLGWFSFASKLEHSCVPNLLVVGLNDQIALLAIKRIKKGEKLTVSYLKHYYEFFLQSERNLRGLLARHTLIFDRIQFDCECPVCLNQWNGPPELEAALTVAQNNAYKKSISAVSFKKVIKYVGRALDVLTDSVNTVQHHRVYAHLKTNLNMAQCSHRLNKTYNSVACPFEGIPYYIDI